MRILFSFRNLAEKASRFSSALSPYRCRAWTASIAIVILCVTGNVAFAATPCCAVTEIGARGLVTAKENNGERSFQFQVSDALLLRRLRVGAPVYANFETRQVSLDGVKACCEILAILPGPKPVASSGVSSSTPVPTASTLAFPPVATETVQTGLVLTDFSANTHGFEFTNYFTGDMLVDLPLIGRVDLGNTTYGLCGGMVFAALDTFKLGAVTPNEPTTPPASGTEMRSYLYERQINSFKYSDGFLVRRLVAWMRKPLNDNTVPNPLAEGGVNVIERGLIHLSAKEFREKIRPELDAGKPVPIVLVKASGEDMVRDPKAAFTMNHQVLATGYQRHGDEWDIYIYDPNMPNTLQTLHVDGRFQTQKGGTARTGSFRGFFEAPYRLERPPWVHDSATVQNSIRNYPAAPFPRPDSDL